MKKHLTLLLTAACLVACVDERDSLLPADGLGLSVFEPTEVSIYDGSFRMAVLKSGKGFDAADVTVEPSAEALRSYNESAGTHYFPIDSKLYTIAGNEAHFGAEDFASPLTITWDIDAVSAYMDEWAQYGVKDFAIPVALTGNTIPVYEGHGLAVLHIARSVVSLAQTEIEAQVDLEAEGSSTLRFQVGLDRLVGQDIRLDFAIDNSLIDSYNALHGTSFAAAPEGLLRIASNPVVLPAGVQSQRVELTLTPSVLGGADFDGYLVPVRLTGSDLKGLGIGEDVLYVVLTPKKAEAGKFFRLWGKYSLEGLWFNGWLNGLAEGNDRNIAMDDEYVYVVKAAADGKGVWAISLEKPSLVREVDMTGVAGGYFETACVRTIPNPATGKPILLLSSMSMDAGSPVMVYAYENGIDAAPKAILSNYTIPSWASRRFGDQFTVYGDWQSGEFWMRSMTSSTSARWSIRGGEVTNAGHAPDGWGNICPSSSEMGALYRYDMNSKSLLYVTPTQASFWDFDGNEKPWSTPTDLSRSFGFQVITFGEDHLIAYVQVDADRKGGTLKVIRDSYGTEDGFQKALEENDVFFEAPVQSEDPEQRSAFSTANMMGGCAAQVVGDNLYVAAHIQGVGLSVFKMTK
ncbi:MAG: DUF1735 domain-containing protein [Bacteroidales bacterium]|nr:DUF1735 domain-containing protein [Bacteroidales bacterium]